MYVHERLELTGDRDAVQTKQCSGKQNIWPEIAKALTLAPLFSAPSDLDNDISPMVGPSVGR